MSDNDLNTALATQIYAFAIEPHLLQPAAAASARTAVSARAGEEGAALGAARPRSHCMASRLSICCGYCVV